MKIVVAIIVYNREKNIKHWCDCLIVCNRLDATIVFFQNSDTFNAMYSESDDGKLLLIQRKNIGYDIGAFQDVCRDRLQGCFPEYDRLLWLTDDVFCMSKDFIKQFSDAMLPDVGVAAMEISPHVKKHIRTSAFMVTKEVAERLTFPADPIVTKRHCYEFEHMGKNAFYEQVIRMGFKVVQVAPNKVSPLWDTGYLRKLDRFEEHKAIFGPCPMPDKLIPKTAYL